jgi:hypothetical protein
MSANVAERRLEAPAAADAVRVRQGRDLRRRRRLRALALLMFAAALEVVLILPFVDHLADSHPTIHFTQHGLIFLGGVLMGIALRDAWFVSR